MPQGTQPINDANLQLPSSTVIVHYGAATNVHSAGDESLGYCCIACLFENTCSCRYMAPGISGLLLHGFCFEGSTYPELVQLFIHLVSSYMSFSIHSQSSPAMSTNASWGHLGALHPSSFVYVYILKRLPCPLLDCNPKAQGVFEFETVRTTIVTMLAYALRSPVGVTQTLHADEKGRALTYPHCPKCQQRACICLPGVVTVMGEHV